MPKKAKDPNAPSISVTVRRYLSVNRRHAAIILLSMFVTIVTSLFVGIRAYLFGKLVNDVQLGVFYGFLAVLPLLIAQVAYIPLDIVRGILSATFANRCARDMQKHTFHRVAHADMQTLETHKTGDLLSRVNRDLEGFSGSISGFLDWNLPSIVVFVVTLGISIAVSWQLSLIAYIAIPLLGFAMSKTAGPMSKYSHARSVANGDALSLAYNLIGGFSLAKSYDLHDAMEGRFAEAADRAVKAGIKASTIDFSLRPMQMMMIFLPLLLITGVGSYFVSKGMMTAGGILTFIMLSTYVLQPMNNLPWMIRGLYTAAGYAQRVFEVWDIPQEQDGLSAGQVDLTSLEPVTFSDVSFAYHDKSQVLSGLSFSLKPGEKVALVGPSGCGKSTTLKLLLHFYRQQTGQITTMGIHDSTCSLEELRTLFSYVGQDAYLFPGTIWQNVAMGREGAGDQQIIRAIQAAQLHDLDLHQEVGERGMRLSGGQRQRVCIARAILKDAPILLLDEPTSALDTESEYLVNQALEELIRGKTTLLVAHRLSAMRGIDRILCIEGGKIVEEGTHEQLMQKSGLYSRLYQAQTQEEGAAS